MVFISLLILTFCTLDQLMSEFCLLTTFDLVISCTIFRRIYFSSLQKLCVGIFSEFSNNVRPSISRRWFSVYNNKLQYQSKLKVSKMHIHRMNSSSQISPLALFQISLVSSSRRYHDCRRRSSTMFDKDRRGERATILFWSSLPNENFFAAGRVWGCQTGLDSFHTSMTFQNTCILLFASIDNEIW